MALSAQLSKEVAASVNDPYYRLFDDMPWSDDDTLAYLLGGDTDFYDLILKDSKAKALLEARERNIVLREYEVKPASSSAVDKKAAEGVKEILLGFDFDQFTSDLVTNSQLKGNAFVEVIWGIDGKTTFIKEALSRPVYRFRFRYPKEGLKSGVANYRRHEVRLLSTSDLYKGDLMPDKRIVCHAYGQKDGNPWGIGLGRVLYWLAVVFKKEMIKQRMIFLDKYAQPTGVGTAPREATREQRQEFNRIMSAIQKGGSAILPHGWDYRFLEAQRSSSNDVYQSAIDWCNSEMAQVVLGETLSTELGNNGSRAAAQTHQAGSSVLLAKFDCDRLSTGPYKQLADWITEINFPDAKPPMIWKLFPELQKEEEDLNARVNRDNTLNTLGYKIKPEKVREVYGDGYEDLAAAEAEAMAKQPQPGINLGFSEAEYQYRKNNAFRKRLVKC